MRKPICAVALGAALWTTAGAAWAQGGGPSLLPLPTISPPPAQGQLAPAAYPLYASQPTVQPRSAQTQQPAAPRATALPVHYQNASQTAPAVKPVPQQDPGYSTVQPPSHRGTPVYGQPVGYGPEPGYGSGYNDDDGVMLNEWGEPIYPSGVGCDSCYEDALGGCGPCELFPWSISAGTMFITRDKPNAVHLSYESTTPSVCRMKNNPDSMDYWQSGWEITGGRAIGCTGRLELTYWGMDPSDDRISFTPPPGFAANTSLNLMPIPGLPQLTFDGYDLDYYFDGASQHVFGRRNEIHNAEINFLDFAFGSGVYNRLSLAGLAGFRYFRFDEDIVFGAVRYGYRFGDDGGRQEAYYDINTVNDLYGLQMGVQMDYYLTRNISLFFTPKAGVFYNDAQQQSQMYRGDGVTAFDISSADDTLSFIGQLDAGVNVQFTRRWSGYIGYRLVAVSGVALADNQIPAYIQATNQILDVDTNGDLILHGGIVGLTYSF